MRVGIAKRALNDNPFCGDECGCWQNGSKTILCMVDGLGHGEHAHTAAKAAVNYVAGHYSEPLVDIFSSCDKEIRNTRGVAMGICLIDEEKHTLTFAGISNIRAMIFGDRARSMSSQYGIVGGGYRKLVPETVPLEPGRLVVMFTDGLPETIRLTGYDEELRRDPQKLAQRILDDCCLGSDDAAVLVYGCGQNE